MVKDDLSTSITSSVPVGAFLLAADLEGLSVVVFVGREVNGTGPIYTVAHQFTAAQ